MTRIYLYDRRKPKTLVEQDMDSGACMNLLIHSPARVGVEHLKAWRDVVKPGDQFILNNDSKLVALDLDQ